MNPSQSRADEYFGRRPVVIPTETLRKLSVLNGYRAAGYIVIEWSMIFAVIWLGWRFLNPAVYVLTVLVIGGRQHALAILMHEGAHFLLLKNKSLNDWISDVFLGWPVIISTPSYRSNHWVHHRYTNTEKDPDCERKMLFMDRHDWEFPTSWGHLARLALKDFSGLGFIEFMKVAVPIVTGESKAALEGAEVWRKRVRVAFYLVILGAAIWGDFWKQLLLFWVVPYMTAFIFFLRLRTIAEHFATENDNPLNITRTTLASWWERIFIPHNINYHIEHHLFPSVPFYHLGELHTLLMEQESFKKDAHVTQSYFGVLKECIELKGHKRTCLPMPDSQTLTTKAG